MNNNIEIKITRTLGDDHYITDTKTLFPKTPIVSVPANPFFWKGEYNNHKIMVTQPLNTSIPKLEKHSDLNISDQIMDEVKRITRFRQL